ncbi:MAG: adenylate kinase [Leptolyngbya sp. SIO1E4]|nr:adenylate kinase [Leptolyngbya sp. SIO1E4]
MQFIFLGPPGAGKGTQASILAERWHIPHISTGDILRQEIAGKTSLGIQARTHVEAGELVPDILVMALMRERFSAPDMKSGWILDGFPRTLSQAQALDELLEIVRHPHPTVVYFEVTPEHLVERMLARGRLDDTEETIRRRLEVYREDTAPLIDFYQRRNCLTAINGNYALDEVANTLQESLLQNQHSVLA